MTKKDYVLIAKVISDQYCGLAGFSGANVLRETVTRLSEELEKENPRFDPEKFRRACLGERITK